MNVVFVKGCVPLTVLSLPPRDSGPIPQIFQWIYNGAKFADNSFIKTGSGSATQPAYMGGDRMLLWLFSIVGVFVGVIAAEKSTSVVTDSEALMLIGISLIGVAVRLRRR